MIDPDDEVSYSGDEAETDGGQPLKTVQNNDVYHNNITWIGRGRWANDIQTVSADFNDNDYVRSDFRK